MTDGTRVRVLLALDRYQRGNYRVESIQRSATVKSPGFVAKTFPNIPQLQALDILTSRLREEIKKAAGE